MRNLMLLLLIAVPFYSFAQQVDSKLLQGQWVLSDIQSKDSIWVAVTTEAASTSKTKGAEPGFQQKKISIVEYMQKDMVCGVTRFVFINNTFQFFRGEELTFSGIVKLKGHKMILEYGNEGDRKTKENTIVSLTGDKLVLSSESKKAPVFISFTKN